MNSFSNNLIEQLKNQGTNFFEQIPDLEMRDLSRTTELNKNGLEKRIREFLKYKFADLADLVYNAWVNKEGEVFSKKRTRVRKKIPSSCVTPKRIYKAITAEVATRSYMLIPQIIQKKNGELKINFGCQPLPDNQKPAKKIEPIKEEANSPLKEEAQSTLFVRIANKIKSFVQSIFSFFSERWNYFFNREAKSKAPEIHFTFSDKYQIIEEGDIEIFPSDLLVSKHSSTETTSSDESDKSDKSSESSSIANNSDEDTPDSSVTADSDKVYIIPDTSVASRNEVDITDFSF